MPSPTSKKKRKPNSTIKLKSRFNSKNGFHPIFLEQLKLFFGVEPDFGAGLLSFEFSAAVSFKTIRPDGLFLKTTICGKQKKLGALVPTGFLF